METLTLAHLSPYLPYELKGIFTYLPGGREFELASIIVNKGNDEYDDNVDVSGTCGRFGGETADISNFKPILRPMKDLFFGKIVEHGVQNYFMNILLNEQLYGLEMPVHFNEVDAIHRRNEFLQRLYGWHFDVFGLIEKGLAISIHDVKEITNA